MESNTGLIIDDFTPFITELENEQIAEDDTGINYAEEYRKQTGKDRADLRYHRSQLPDPSSGRAAAVRGQQRCGPGRAARLRQRV